MDWRNGAALVLSLLLSAGVTPHGHAQGIEQKHVTIAVGGVTGQMDKLPLAIAVHLGYFKTEGLDVDAVDFNSGAKGLEALVGGSAEVAQGSYEHIPELQAKRVMLTSIMLFSRYPANVLMIPKNKAADFHGIADLKGKTIGISSPGSATQSFLALVLAKNGIALDCCSYVGVGTGPTAVAAMRAGKLDALVTLEPNTTILDSAGDVKILADSRFAEGTREYYGGDDQVGSLIAKSDWVKSHPNTSQALANAMAHAMQFLAKSTPDQIVDAVPHEYWMGNRSLYKQVVVNNLPSFLWDGISNDAAAHHAFSSVIALEPALGKVAIDYSKTYTNEFMIKANQKYPR